ncbi:unnamed protein product [Psylliodes chrysocephalus]|uniref:Ionotropic receptor n=1 Tax=Psylliodes chrysocephalus TaxID=3402493 RepID=A0A9P0CUW9_9CUCU|nr:unnamed protein product [Psylliodes chrysocephala]
MNGTMSGYWSELITRNLDVFVTGIITPSSAIGYFETSVFALQDSTHFTVPYIVKEENRLNFFGIFDKYIWIALTSSLLLLIVFYITVTKLLKFENKYTKTHLIVTMFQLQMDGSPIWKPRSDSVKLITVIFLYLFLILNTCFKGKLFNSRVSDNINQEYETLEDIVNKKLKVGIHDVAKNILNSSENVFEKYIVKNGESCGIDLYCLNRTAFQKDFATIKFKSTVEYLLPRLYVDENGLPLINTIDTFTHLYLYFHFFFRKGHPLFETFNRELIHLHQHGLISKILHDFQRNNTFAMVLAKRRDILKFSSVALIELKSIFQIYLVCILVSFVVFCLEMIQSRKSYFIH